MKSTYKVSFLFGKLLLMVAYWPLPKWWFGVRAGFHTLIWPPDARLFEVPWQIALTAPTHLLFTFYASLAVNDRDRWFLEPDLVYLRKGVALHCFAHERSFLQYLEARLKVHGVPWSTDVDDPLDSRNRKKRR